MLEKEPNPATFPCLLCAQLCATTHRPVLGGRVQLGISTLARSRAQHTDTAPEMPTTLAVTTAEAGVLRRRRDSPPGVGIQHMFPLLQGQMPLHRGLRKELHRRLGEESIQGAATLHGQASCQVAQRQPVPTHLILISAPAPLTERVCARGCRRLQSH